MGKSVFVALAFVAALAVAGGGQASLETVETYTVNSPALLSYHSVDVYSGTDAADERDLADLDADGFVSADEASLWEADFANGWVGTTSSWFRWDGNDATWVLFQASATGLQGPVNSGELLTVLIDGTLSIRSNLSGPHTLSIDMLTGYSSWQVRIIVPSSWSFGLTTGLSVQSRTATELHALHQGGTATIRIGEAAAGGSDAALYAGIGVGIVALVGVIFFIERRRSAAAKQASSPPPTSSAAAAPAAPAQPPAKAAAAPGPAAAPRPPPAQRSTPPPQPPPPPARPTPTAGQPASPPAARVGYPPTATQPLAPPPPQPPRLATPQVPPPPPQPPAYPPPPPQGQPPPGQSYRAAYYSGVGYPPGQAPQPYRPPAYTPPPPPQAASQAPPAAPPLARVAPTPPPAPAATAPARPYVVEGLFLIYQDGRLIYQRGAGEMQLENPELISSMFTAVSQFIRDSFAKQEELNRMGYGANTILIDRGKYLYGAAIAYGEPDAELRELLHDTIERVEYSYAGVVEHWDGRMDAFARVSELAAPLFALTAELTRGDVLLATTERTVKMLSEIEYYNGFIRLKCAVVNNTEMVVTKVTVDLDYNEDVLRLAKIEPASYRVARAQVLLGVVNTGEKISVAYYFDPQICTQTNIDGVVRYRDARGTLRSVTMKTRRAEVVCPLFFTKEHANTAMLKRLIEAELTSRDSKLFRVTKLPAHMALEHVFSLVREVVERHDVKLVREFKKFNPFQGEAWFYGETKVKQHKVVIRAAVFEEARAIEFFVAAESTAAVTGLLAEFGHTLHSLIVERYAELSVEQVLEEDAKAAVGAKARGLDEAAAASA